MLTISDAILTAFGLLVIVTLSLVLVFICITVFKEIKEALGS